MRTMRNYSLRNLTLVLLSLVAYSPTITQGAPAEVWRMTQNVYLETANLEQAVKNEFGPAAVVADWEEIKQQFGGSLDSIRNFCNQSGIPLEARAYVTRNGQHFWCEDCELDGNGNLRSRHYLMGRFDGSPPPNWLSHDNIQNKFLDLGSWFYSYHVLAKLPALMVLDPNGGEKLVAGSKYTITWESFADPNINYVLIEYSTNNGQTWNDVDIWWNTGSYQWDPIPTVDSNQCLVRISNLFDPNVSDTSDDVFTIFQCTNPIQGDLNGDCYVDFRDFAIVAEQWLKCGNPFDPACQP